MVRTIMGTFLMLEEQGLGERDLRLIMETGIRSNAGGTAPGRGLFLERVDYDEQSTICETGMENAEPPGGLDSDRILPPTSGD
jgi:tRNA U38,U39,U40 pseudouridine synthase TruA